MAAASVGLRRGGRAHAHLGSGTHPLDAIDDHLVAGDEPCLDHPVALEPLAELDGARLRLVPADTAPALRLRYDPAAVPPWRKRLWRDPEAVTTGG